MCSCPYTFRNIANSQDRKKLLSVSSGKDELADDFDERKEEHVAGHIQLSTYKYFIGAAHNNIYVFVVFLVFIVTQIFWNGSEFLLAVW